MSTGIEWTDETWNPTTGCTKVSPGCDHCYAEVMYERFNGKGSFSTVKMHSSRLAKPFHWRKPRKVFVNSMSDLFHQDVTDFFIAEVFAVMALTPRHTYQILTKRHSRMRSLLSSTAFPGLVNDALKARMKDPLDRTGPVVLPNVWLGVSVENQQWANTRIPALLDTPAAVRFLSCEPLLGPVDLLGKPDQGCDEMGPAITHTPYSWQTSDGPTEYDCEHNAGIDWVVVGGESGHGARPMHPDWARSLRDQCVEMQIPFLFKQWGNWAPGDFPTAHPDVLLNATTGKGTYEAHRNQPGNERLIRVGKKAAGRELDGRTWDQYPATAVHA